MLVWLAPWLSGSLLPQSDPEFKIYSPSPWCSHWGALETNLQFSPLGLVPKKDGSQHIIMNLSSPRCFSINDFTSKEDYTLHYATFNHALAPVPLFGTSALTAELDLKHTFCLCSVSPSNWYLLPMHWQGKFFVDLRLPFGLHSSPILSLTVSLMPLSGKAPSNSLPTTLEFAGIPFSVVPDNGTHSQHKSYSYITLPFRSLIKSASKPLNYIWLVSGLSTLKIALQTCLQMPPQSCLLLQGTKCTILKF